MPELIAIVGARTIMFNSSTTRETVSLQDTELIL